MIIQIVHFCSRLKTVYYVQTNNYHLSVEKSCTLLIIAPRGITSIWKLHCM